MFKVSLFELRMKLDINPFCYFLEISISYFDYPYRTNGSQLAQELQKN